MIKFSLKCAQDHGFEAWFPDNDSFDDQKSRGLVTCPLCNDAMVEKTIMAPSVLGGRARGRDGAIASQEPTSVPTFTPPPKPTKPAMTPPQAWGPEQVAAARQVLHAVRAQVEKTHEDVGDKFADEARAIHEGEKPERGIMGKASKEQVDELLDDGIEILPLPNIKLDA